MDENTDSNDPSRVERRLRITRWVLGVGFVVVIGGIEVGGYLWDTHASDSVIGHHMMLIAVYLAAILAVCSVVTFFVIGLGLGIRQKRHPERPGGRVPDSVPEQDMGVRYLRRRGRVYAATFLGVALGIGAGKLFHLSHLWGAVVAMDAGLGLMMVALLGSLVPPRTGRKHD